MIGKMLWKRFFGRSACEKQVNKREWHGKQEIKAKIHYASHINRGYYMAARGYKISLRVYISRVSQANE